MLDCPDRTGGGLCRRADGPLTCGDWCPRNTLKGVAQAEVHAIEKMGADPVHPGPNIIALMLDPVRPGLCWETRAPE